MYGAGATVKYRVNDYGFIVLQEQLALCNEVLVGLAPCGQDTTMDQRCHSDIRVPVIE